ncbi:unnamed protein product [Brachionus calyciflorus]|uniref:Vacuolar protein sorting-associated protein 26C n=1 Tax=Brachionus calyciflorus TaxID=104777 RepID=A0A814A7L0_9BILA|nr:unnamed protein product [Brachionus calyciflorus]
MSQCTIDIRLKRSSKEYTDGDVIAGEVVITGSGSSPIQHNGIYLSLDGMVNINLSTKNVGVFEAFYNSAKPIQLINYSLEISRPGKLPTNRAEIPFEIPLRAKSSIKYLYETYHGVFINVQYLLKVDMKRSFLNKDISKQVEILMITRPTSDLAEKAVAKPIDFQITPDSLTNVKDKSKIPNFSISGQIDSTVCCIQKAFNGHLTVNESSVPIKSIEIQLVRVETCGCAEGYAKDLTEIQNIQIGEGDVPRGIAIPIYMIFPRLFTCPTLITTNFKIEFEINLVAIFEDDRLITENFPIKLTRF